MSMMDSNGWNQETADKVLEMYKQGKRSVRMEIKSAQ